ncbi:MAG: hypothetical protein WC752_04610 [Patescibacteria group bacterium]|jgi:hypothetical protein
MKKILLLLLLALPLTTYSQEEFNLSEFVGFDGSVEGDRLGSDMANVGDIDNDGYDDFLISASEENSDTGAVFLFYGRAETITNIDLADADAKITGEAAEDYAGSAVSGLGDVNGDGYDDFIIGASGYGAGNKGAAYVIYGGSTRYTDLNPIANIARVIITGKTDGDQAGYSVATAGDVNNDNYNDILIGAPGNDDGFTNSGAIYVIYGGSSIPNMSLDNADLEFTGETLSDDLGFSVSHAGDVNCDGIDDLMAGAFFYSSSKGRSYIIFGSETLTSGTIASKANVRLTGEQDDDQSGRALVGVGDANGDSCDDVLIGANQYDYSGSEMGAAYLIYGSATLTDMSLSDSDVKFTGEGDTNLAGKVVEKAGDVNNDGYSDLMIGAPGNYSSALQAGAYYIIYGSASLASNISLSNADIKLSGEAAFDAAGYAISGADINGDGFSDVIAGSYVKNSYKGKAYIGYLYIDNDNDGIAGTDGLLDGIDCNDSDNTVSANQTYYIDSDLDGYGSITSASFCSGTAPAGYSANNTDCSDTDSTINANQTYYQDLDGDGLGNASVTTAVCSLTAPAGYVTNSNDTNDAIKDISTITAGDNGDITITYINNEASIIDVFSYTGTDEMTLKQYQDNYYLALHPKAKKLALIDINTLTVLSRKTLSKKSFPTNSLKTYTLRNKKWAVITAKNKKGKVKLSVVKIIITQEKLGKKVSASLVNKKITPAKTKKNKNTILLRSKKNVIITKYLLTKKLILKEI